MPINAIKQPKPSVLSETKDKTVVKRTINRPYIGVIDPGYIKKITIQNKILEKREEMPRLIYKGKPNPRRGKALSYQNLSTLTVIGLSILSLFKLLFKKIK